MEIRSGFLAQLLRIIVMLLLLVPMLLVGWFLPDVFGVFGDGSGRQKPMSAEAKFLWIVFVLLLILGFSGWWLWRHLGSH